MLVLVAVGLGEYETLPYSGVLQSRASMDVPSTQTRRAQATSCDSRCHDALEQSSA